MVRPGGRGSGGNAPPPPEYMAGMIQQFELNRQFMENMMAQFPRPNMNQQPAQVRPGDDCSSWQSTPVAVPPLSCGSLQEEGSKGDIAGRGYISRLHLIGDVTEPVISIQRLS